MKKLISIAALTASASILLTGCGGLAIDAGETESPDEVQVQDAPTPQNDWVKVFDRVDGMVILKRCDGTTLVYRMNDYRGGITVIPDSPECFSD